MDVLNLKWENIMGLPQTRRLNYAIWVIIYRSMKYANFIHVKYTYMAEDYGRFYLSKIVSLHGIHLSIIRCAQFNSRFGRSFKRG